MGLFESMGIALDPNLGKLATNYNETWKLHHSALIDASYDYPGHTISYLDADCEIIVDMKKVREDFRNDKITVEEYLTEYGNGDIADLEYATITLMNTVKDDYKILKDSIVIDRMAIFIHSEDF